MLQNVGLHNKFVRRQGRLQLAQHRPRITLTEHRYMLYESFLSFFEAHVGDTGAYVSIIKSDINDLESCM